MLYNYQTKEKITYCLECGELLNLCECRRCQECEELTAIDIADTKCECGGEFY